MQKSITGILIFFAALLMLSSCNMPLEKNVEKATPANQFLNVGKTTELRSGPGEVYDLIGVLNPNQAVEVIGRSADGKYLMIHNPANPQVYVWLKNEAGMFVDDPINLPVATAPSTPTPVITLTCFMCGTNPNVPTPVSTPTPVITTVTGTGCPTPIGGGPTPVSCTLGDAPATDSGCPTPIGGGPTPIICSQYDAPATGSGCPTPIGGGPTLVSCSGSGGAPVIGSGCPTPIGGGPTPIICSQYDAPATGSGCPTPIGGGPTSVSCSGKIVPQKPVRGIITIPTAVK